MNKNKKKPNSVNKIQNGKDITVVSSSYSTIEIAKIYKDLKKKNLN